MSADPDRACPHRDFAASVEVNRFTEGNPDPDAPPQAYMADIRVECADCGEPFRWTGCRAGVDFRQPRVSVDERELHAPLRPASADPDFGLSLPGFAVGFRPGPAAEGGNRG